MSPTSILNGCMAMLMLVSRSIRAMTPKMRTVVTDCMPSDPELGSRHITATATAAPINK
jgi:hypothetical protein